MNWKRTDENAWRYRNGITLTIHQYADAPQPWSPAYELELSYNSDIRILYTSNDRDTVETVAHIFMTMFSRHYTGLHLSRATDIT